MLQGCLGITPGVLYARKLLDHCSSGVAQIAGLLSNESLGAQNVVYPTRIYSLID